MSPLDNLVPDELRDLPLLEAVEVMRDRLTDAADELRQARLLLLTALPHLHILRARSDSDALRDVIARVTEEANRL